jgi:hypothetical protein
MIVLEAGGGETDTGVVVVRNVLGDDGAEAYT